MGLQLACAALAPDVLYDAERKVSAPLLDFARRVTVAGDPALEIYLPRRWPARLVVKTRQRSLEETVIDTGFDADAPGLAALLHDKWRRLPGDGKAGAPWP
jgi:hypothetical protein